MSCSDGIRWGLMFLCVFNMGVMVALFERVGKTFLPSLWMRMLFLSNIGAMLVIAVGAHARLGQPLSYRTPLYGVTLLVQIVALAGLHHWYGTKAGRAHSARMTAR